MSLQTAITGENSRPDQRPVYLYRVGDDTGTILYLTSYPTDISVSSVPAAWTDASDPQVFTAAPCIHGSVEVKNGLDELTTEFQILISTGVAYSRYCLSGVIPRIEVTIAKVQIGAALAGAAVWNVDTGIRQRGLVSKLSVVESTLTLEITPEPLLGNQDVPRWRFGRTCNRQLYADDCGVDRTNYQHQNAILAFDIATRQLTVSGDGGFASGYFRQGVLTHGPTGMRLPVFNSAVEAGNTIITLHQWLPDIEVSDNVILNAGCRHTYEECRDKFSNEDNFGGFPSIPTKNPTIHGAE